MAQEYFKLFSLVSSTQKQQLPFQPLWEEQGGVSPSPSPSPCPLHRESGGKWGCLGLPCTHPKKSKGEAEGDVCPPLAITPKLLGNTSQPIAFYSRIIFIIFSAGSSRRSLRWSESLLRCLEPTKPREGLCRGAARVCLPVPARACPPRIIPKHLGREQPGAAPELAGREGAGGIPAGWGWPALE